MSRNISDTDIRRLFDERDIVAIATRYCRALDSKDWTLLHDVFVADATADLSGPTELVGIEAIIGRIRQALQHLDESQHLVGNHEVDVSGDEATHRCYFQAQHVRATAPEGPNYIVAGRYDDHLVRRDEGWRIAHRTLTVMWTDGDRRVPRPG